MENCVLGVLNQVIMNKLAYVGAKGNPKNRNGFRTVWKYSTKYGADLSCRHVSHCIRKPTVCIGENKGADQLCNYCTVTAFFSLHG